MLKSQAPIVVPDASGFLRQTDPYRIYRIRAMRIAFGVVAAFALTAACASAQTTDPSNLAARVEALEQQVAALTAQNAAVTAAAATAPVQLTPNGIVFHPTLSGPFSAPWSRSDAGCLLRVTGEGAGSPALVCRANAYFLEGYDTLTDGVSLTPSWRTVIAQNGNVAIGHRSLAPGRYDPQNRMEIDAYTHGVYIGNTDEGLTPPVVPPQGLRVQGPIQVDAGGLQFLAPVAPDLYNGKIVWIPITVTLPDGSTVTAWLYASR